MSSVHRRVGIGIVLTGLGALLVFGIRSVSEQKAAHVQPVTRLLTPTVPPTLTPTLAPDHIKATYTFYIHATSQKAANGELVLTPSDTGKTFTMNIGTLILLTHFNVGQSRMIQSSPQAIFKNTGSPETIHLPNNALGAFRVYHAGFGTLTVYETNFSPVKLPSNEPPHP